MQSQWLNSSLAGISKNNASVYDHLAQLFVETWSTEVNYANYFSECAPISCTYKKLERINFSSAITLFFSLYGGLVIIIRLFASFTVNIFTRIRNDVTHQQLDFSMYLDR